MSHDDRDLDMERRLREALASTAEAVQPGGDGLMRIQQRVAEGRGRDRWLRPALVLGSVVVVAAIAVGGVAIARHGTGAAKVGPGHSPSPTPTINPVVSDGFPEQAFFPFSNAAEEASWEQQSAGGHSPWISDPGAVSESWVDNYLKFGAGVGAGTVSITGTSADVTMQRAIAGSEHPVAIVHLVKFHHAWLVTGASSAQGDLVISSPAPGATGNSPLTVSGPGFGVDERANVEVRDAETPALLGQAKTGMFGGGTSQWSASVSFTPSDEGFGVVVVSIASPADGGLGEFTAQKVVFTTASPVAKTAGFYGVQGGVIERFDAGGAPAGPVAGSSAHGTVAEVHQAGGTLYFTAGTTDCPSTLYSLPAGGGTPLSAAQADQGYGIEGFDVTADGLLTYYERSCTRPMPDPQAKLWFEVVRQTPGAHTTGYISFPSEPPAIVGDPVWEADGTHVDAFVRTGMQGYLARYDSTHGNKTMPGAVPCGQYDPATQLTGAVATAPDGTLWFAGQTGSSMQVLSCDAGQPTVRFTIPVNGTPQSLAVDSSGTALLADSDGNVWRAAAGGTPSELSTKGGVSSVTW